MEAELLLWILRIYIAAGALALAYGLLTMREKPPNNGIPWNQEEYDECCKIKERIDKDG